MSDRNLWWGKPLNSRRYHIFGGDGFGNSLCGNWMFNNDGKEPEVDIENNTFTDGEDCKKCCRKVGLIDD